MGRLLLHRLGMAAKRAVANELQDFIYTYYPEHEDICEPIDSRIRERGGSEL